MIIPYNTDAPIYHWPIVTVCMIAVNVFVFAWEIANPEDVEPLMLAVGGTLSPIQWLTNNFLHADPMHLIGNMIFLWSFGLVVEGKLGPWKTLLVYLGIGILYGATVQILLLAHTPGNCLGASAVIFGFMAMCLIWAPENSMDCVLFISFRAIHFELPIKVLVGLYVGWQILVLCLTKGELSSEYLHAVGAAYGFAVGIAMLKTNHVDCENWDIFSVWAGRHEMTDVERARADARKPEAKKRRVEQAAKRRDMMYGEIRRALDESNPMPAFVIHQKMKTDFRDWILPESDLLNLIQTLLEKGFGSEAASCMGEYLEHYTRKASLVRLNLANLLVERNQPRSALDTLAQVDPSELNPSQTTYFRSLHEKATRMSR